MDGEKEEGLIEGYKLLVVRRRSSKDLMYNVVTIVGNSVVYT